MALESTFKRVIDKAYHINGNTGIMGDRFGQLTPFEILQKLRKTYGRANIQVNCINSSILFKKTKNVALPFQVSPHDGNKETLIGRKTSQP